jgi:threonine dehydrogenase-like Zn-dependent dehydrogenase
VVVDPFIHCGLCYQCRTGHTNLCVNREIYGKHRGGFAEYSVVPDRAICKLPAGLTLQEGALLENLGIAVHATEFKVHHPGDYAVVIGAGPIGLLACQVLETHGVQVIVTDIRQSRLELATTLTAATSVNIENMELVEAVMDLTEGRGADFVLEAAATQSALDQAFDIVGPGGTVVTIGTFDKSVTFNPFFQMTRREIRFIGSLGRTWSTWNKMVKLLSAHEVDLSSMITHVLALEDFERGFDLAASYDAMKVLLKP